MKRRTAIKITAIGALAPKLDTLSPALGHLPTGAGGLAELVEPTPFLATLADRGVKAAVFEGSSRAGQLVDVADGR